MKNWKKSKIAWLASVLGFWIPFAFLGLYQMNIYWAQYTIYGNSEWINYLLFDEKVGNLFFLARILGLVLIYRWLSKREEPGTKWYESKLHLIAMSTIFTISMSGLIHYDGFSYHIVTLDEVRLSLPIEMNLVCLWVFRMIVLNIFNYIDGIDNS